jgi:nitrous oxidase accessory protein NosD
VLPGASGLERTLRAFGSPDRYVTNITIPDLTVDGNRSILTKIGSEEESHSTIYLIFVDDVLLERVEATNAQGAGFRIGSLQNSNPARNVTLRDCRATGNFQNGVAPTLVDNFLMEGCYVADTELVVSVDFETHDSMDVKKNCTVRDCTFTGVKQPILVRDIRGCRTVNNTILRTEASGDTVPAITVVPNDEPTSGVVIANNDIRDLTATQPAAIYTGNSNGASVTGNPIIGGKVGIRLLSASTDTFVSGNSIRNMDEHGIAGKFDLPYSRIVDNAIVDDRSPSRLKNGIYHSENNQAFPVVVSRNVIRGAQTAINLDDSSAKQGDPWIVSENLID